MKRTFHIQWHITEKCNLNCIHCYKEPFRKELSLEKLKFVFDNIIKFIKRKNFELILTLTGGEPFLKAEIYDLLEYIEIFEEVSKVNFISNGTILPERNLLKLKKFFRYYISLESWLIDDNDKIRGQGVFKKVLDNIKILQDSGYNNRIGIMTTLLNSNIKNFIDIEKFYCLIDFMKKTNIEEIIFERFVPVGNSKNLKYEVVDDNTILKFYETISKFYDINFDEIKNYKAIKIFFNFKNSSFCEVELLGAQCTSGKDGVAVLCDGSVYPCRRLDIEIGNLLKDSLEDILDCSKFFKFFEVFKDKDFFNCYAMAKSYVC